MKRNPSIRQIESIGNTIWECRVCSAKVKRKDIERHFRKKHPKEDITLVQFKPQFEETSNAVNRTPKQEHLPKQRRPPKQNRYKICPWCYRKIRAKDYAKHLERRGGDGTHPRKKKHPKKKRRKGSSQSRNVYIKTVLAGAFESNRRRH